MEDNNSTEAKAIAMLVQLCALSTSRSLNDPNKTSLVGSWVSVLGDTLSAIANTEQYSQSREEEKKKILKEIDELQKRLAQLQ